MCFHSYVCLNEVLQLYTAYYNNNKKKNYQNFKINRAQAFKVDSNQNIFTRKHQLQKLLDSSILTSSRSYSSRA